MFEWDPAKNKANLAKHGVSFERASRIFLGPIVSWVDGRGEYGELREISLGMADAVLILIVVHTDRAGVIRLISARKATPQERRRYETSI